MKKLLVLVAIVGMLFGACHFHKQGENVTNNKYEVSLDTILTKTLIVTTILSGTYASVQLLRIMPFVGRFLKDRSSTSTVVA
jgi:hypothetical protein